MAYSSLVKYFFISLPFAFHVDIGIGTKGTNLESKGKGARDKYVVANIIRKGLNYIKLVTVTFGAPLRFLFTFH